MANALSFIKKVLFYIHKWIFSKMSLATSNDFKETKQDLNAIFNTLNSRIDSKLSMEILTNEHKIKILTEELNKLIVQHNTHVSNTDYKLINFEENNVEK